MLHGKTNWVSKVEDYENTHKLLNIEYKLSNMYGLPFNTKMCRVRNITLQPYLYPKTCLGKVW